MPETRRRGRKLDPPQPLCPWFLKISRRVKDKMIILIHCQKKLSHEFGLENIWGLVFLEMWRREITLNRFNRHFPHLLLASKAVYRLPKTPAPRVNLPFISLQPVQANSPPPHPSPFSHTVCGCQRLWALTNEQNCSLSQQPTGSGTQSPHSQSPWQGPQSWHCFYCLRKKEPKADPQHKSRPNMEREWGLPGLE